MRIAKSTAGTGIIRSTHTEKAHAAKRNGQNDHCDNDIHSASRYPLFFDCVRGKTVHADNPL
jgi:hypothetical protein